MLPPPIPEACQYNTDHTIRITWDELCQLIREELNDGQIYPYGEPCPWDDYLANMNYASVEGLFLMGTYSKVGEFFYEPVSGGPIYHLPYTMWFEPISDYTADVHISVCSYGADIHTTITANKDVDVENPDITIVIGEIIPDPDAFWPVTQLIIEESENT